MTSYCNLFVAVDEWQVGYRCTADDRADANFPSHHDRRSGPSCIGTPDKLQGKCPIVLLFVALLAAGCGNEYAPKEAPMSNGSGFQTHGATPSVARELVEDAVKAHGAEAVRNVQAGRFTLFVRGYLTREIHDEITMVTTFQRPDQIHESTKHLTTSEGKIRSSRTRKYVLDRGRAVRKEGDEKCQPATDIRRIDDLFPFKLMGELLGLCDENCTLVYAGNETLDQRKVSVLRIEHENECLTELLLDNSTNLLFKISKDDYDPRSRRMCVSETYYSEFRSYSGLTVPTKMIEYLDGEKFVEMTLEEFEVLDQVDPKQFSIIDP